MGLENKGKIDDNPKIPEDYYISLTDGIEHYERDDADSLGLIFDFKVVHEDEEVVLPFFAPAKLSISDERESSRLAENLQNIDRLEPVLEMIDDSGEVKEGVLSQSKRWVAKDEEEAEELISALNAVFTDQDVRVNVEDDQDGDSSQVSKLSRIFDKDEDAGADSASDVPKK